MKRACVVVLGLCLAVAMARAETSPEAAAVGEAAMNAGQYTDADAAFERALTLEPNNARALVLQAEARRRAGAPSAERQVVDLTGVPVEAQDLSGLSLSRLEIVDVHGPRSLWGGGKLEGVAFARAQLNGADLRETQFIDSVLDGAVLDGARVAGATFRGTTLVRARAPKLAARGANFAGARATSADFAGSDFTDADFTEADLRAARFGDAWLRRTRFLNADLRGADLSRARLEDTSLAGARVDCNTRFPRNFDPDGRLLVPLDLCGGRFALDYTGKDVAGLSFRELDIRGAIFTNAKLGGADFREASLDGADFTGASGFDAAFAPASAREASLEGATGALTALEGSDLRNARLSAPAGGQLDLVVGRSGPRLDGASLKRVRILLDAGEGDAPATGAASLLVAQVEESTVVCAAKGRTAETVDLARRIAAANPGVTLAETCRRGR